MTIEASIHPEPIRSDPKQVEFVRMPTEDDLMFGIEALPDGVRLPTEDDLPYSDGEPMESWRHVQQMHLLIDPLELAWATRDDYFIGGNMFLYFSPEQLRNRHFRGPDVFVVQGVPRGERKSWVVWAEGRVPSVIIELLSPTTADIDRGEKKQVYQDEIRVPGYFYFDPWTGEWAGFSLQGTEYVPVEPDAQGRMPCEPLGLTLVKWHGTHMGIEAEWLRWADPEGRLLPTPGEAGEELALAERAKAEAERAKAEAERAKAEAERAKAEAERERADAERRRADAALERAERLAARLRELGEEV